MKNIENLGNKSIKAWCVKHASKLDNHGDISNLISNADRLFKFINSESGETQIVEPVVANIPQAAIKKIEQKNPTIVSKDEILLEKIQLLARSDVLNKKLKDESLKIYADKEGIISADDGTKITDSINKGISDYVQKERRKRIKNTTNDAKLKESRKYFIDIPTSTGIVEEKIELGFKPSKSGWVLDNNSKDKLADIYIKDVLSREEVLTSSKKTKQSKPKKSNKKSKTKTKKK